MRNTVTDIYRIVTMNSIYEIKVFDHNGVMFSCCRKMAKGQENKQVTVAGSDSTTGYLEKLCIGVSFEIPGVVTTSVVKDYDHYVVAKEEKRTTTPAFFSSLTDAIVGQVKGQAVQVPARVHNSPGKKALEKKAGCQVQGCTYSANSGPTHDGSRKCKSGSIASGGTRAHCACDYCF